VKIETMNKLALFIQCLSVVLFIVGIICGLSGSSFGLLLSFAVGIVSMMIYEWLATYIEEWYNNCDDEEM
jgi:hypothetical protein